MSRTSCVPAHPLSSQFMPLSRAFVDPPSHLIPARPGLYHDFRDRVVTAHVCRGHVNVAVTARPPLGARSRSVALAGLGTANLDHATGTRLVGRRTPSIEEITRHDRCPDHLSDKILPVSIEVERPSPLNPRQDLRADEFPILRQSVNLPPW